MTLTWFSEAETALRAVAVLASLYVVQSSAEYLVARNRLRDDDIFSWTVSGQRSAFTNRVASFAASIVMPHRRFCWLLVARLGFGLVAGVLALTGSLAPVPLVGIVVTTLAISVRHPYGLDGGFQMSIVVFVTLSIASLLSPAGVGRQLAALFVAAQVLLSYLVAGVSKLRSPTWRRGDALEGVFGTQIYGNERLHELVRRRPRLDAAARWATIGVECLFPLVLFARIEILAVVLLLGASFHVATAIAMGINGFVFPFLATYPAIVFANRFVTGAI